MTSERIPLPVTLCVSTRNAASLLPGCIESCKDWISEIVVVDMESDDATLDVARRYGAKVVEVPHAGWAEPGRQSGLDAATQPWILVLDADERAAHGIHSIAERAAQDSTMDGVLLPRKNITFGRWHPRAGLWPDYQLRLFRREVTSWSPRIHGGPEVRGKVEKASAQTENAIIHHSFPTISAWVTSTDRYTDHEADRLQAEGKRPSLVRLVGLPPARFVETYVLNRGALSGRYGLAIALLAACYWVLAELKLWERETRG